MNKYICQLNLNVLTLETLSMLKAQKLFFCTQLQTEFVVCFNVQ